VSDDSCKPESADCMLDRIKRERYEEGKSHGLAMLERELKARDEKIRRLEHEIQERYVGSGAASTALNNMIAGKRCRMAMMDRGKLVVLFDNGEGKRDVHLEIVGERIRFDFDEHGGYGWDHPLGSNKP
jgi:hypothetical protein